jgi:hypothetical protein
VDESVELEGKQGGQPYDYTVAAAVVSIPLQELFIPSNVDTVESSVYCIKKVEEGDPDASTKETEPCGLMEVIPVHQLEGNEDRPGAQFDETHSCAEDGLEVHLGVEAPENIPEDDQHCGCDREGEGNYFRVLAKLLIVDLFGDTGKEVVTDHEGRGTGRKAGVIVEVNSSIANRAERTGEVADAALAAAKGTDCAIGNHIPGALARAFTPVEIVARSAHLALGLTRTGRAGRRTDDAGPAQLVVAWVAGLAGSPYELSVGAGEALRCIAGRTVDEGVRAGGAG